MSHDPEKDKWKERFLLTWLWAGMVYSLLPYQSDIETDISWTSVYVSSYPIVT